MDKYDFIKTHTGVHLNRVSKWYYVATADGLDGWIVVRGDGGFDFSKPIATAPTAKQATALARADYRKNVTDPAKQRRLVRMAEELRANGYRVTKIGG